MSSVMNDDGDGSSTWQSYDSADDEDNGAKPFRRLLTPTLNSKLSCARPSVICDQRSSHPTKVTLASRNSCQITDPNLSGSFSSHSGRSFAATFASTQPSLIDRRFLLDDDLSHNVYLFAPPSLTSPPTVMENISVSELVERLGGDEDGVRKMAAFKLQSNIGDPSFAEMFILDGGLAKLKYLIMTASGNTLAYSLASFSRLLEVDKGWECVEKDMIQRVCIPQSTLTPHAKSNPGCRTCRHTPTGQHSEGGYGHSRIGRVSSVHS